MDFLKKFITTTVGFILLITIVVAVHEFAHLLTAVAFGATVDSFSIGFGPELFGFDAGGIHWQVSAIPLGGYVSFPIEAGPGIVMVSSLAAWQQIAIMVAGVVANAFLALGITAVLRARYGAPDNYALANLNMRGFLIVPFVRNAGVTLRAGGKYFWWFVASTSVDLMLFNILFIVPLDGGKIFLTLLGMVGIEPNIGVIIGGLVFSLFIMQPILVAIFMPLLRYVRHAGISLYTGGDR